MTGSDNLKGNKKTIADYLIVGGMGVKIIGSVQTVANEIAALGRGCGCGRAQL